MFKRRTKFVTYTKAYMKIQLISKQDEIERIHRVNRKHSHRSYLKVIRLQGGPSLLHRVTARRWDRDWYKPREKDTYNPQAERVTYTTTTDREELLKQNPWVGKQQKHPWQSKSTRESYCWTWKKEKRQVSDMWYNKKLTKLTEQTINSTSN